MNYSLIFENFINWIELNLYLSLFLYFIFIFLYSLFSLPGLIIFFVFAGYAFNIFWAYIICIVACTFGCCCFFLFSKYFLNKFFQSIYKKYSKKVDNYIKESTLEYLIIFRLIPGPPLLIQNILLSLLNISTYRFILSTSIGISPIMLFSILIGNKLNNLIALNNITTNDILSWDLFLILFVIVFIIIIRIIVKQKSIN